MFFVIKLSLVLAIIDSYRKSINVEEEMTMIKTILNRVQMMMENVSTLFVLMINAKKLCSQEYDVVCKF